MTPEEQCCGSAMTENKKATLTEAVLGKLDTLIMQQQGFSNLIRKVRDVLGVYNPNTGLTSSNGSRSEQPSTPTEPTISDAARRMTKLIQDNEETIMDFENLLKNL